MSFNMRSATDDRLYSPNGDLAHNFHDLVRHVAYGLDQEYWQSWFADYLKYKEVGIEDLENVVKAFVHYLKYANDPETSTVQEALTKAGFFECKEAAQLVLMAKLGQVVSCAYFTRTREANDPELAQKKTDELMQDAEMDSRYFKPKPDNVLSKLKYLVNKMSIYFVNTWIYLFY